MRGWASVLLLCVGLALPGCRSGAGGPEMALGGAVADDAPAAARREPARRPATAADERMTAPPPVDHIAPGERPAEAALPPAGEPAVPVEPRAALSGAVPLHPSLTPAGVATAARDTETTERVSQVFDASEPFDRIVAWYESTLGAGWERRSIPSIRSRTRVTLFERAGEEGSMATVQVAEVEKRVTVTVNETRGTR